MEKGEKLMEVFNWNFKSVKKPLEIVAMADLHVGSTECDMKLIKKTIKLIQKRKAFCILLGDLADVGLRESPGASVYENNMNPKEQLETLIELFRPIRKNILGSIVGNHSWRIEKATGLCFMKIFCDSLQIPYGRFQMMNMINVGKQKYSIFSIHGSSNAMTTEGRINAFKKQLDTIESDIYTFGHTHDKALKIFSKRIIVENKVIEKKQYMVLCGNFLNYGGYSEMKGLPVMQKGAPLIKLYPNKHKVEVDLHWWEKD